MKALSCLVIAVALSLAGSAKATGVPLRFAAPVYAPVYAPPVVVQQQFSIDPYAGAAFAPAFAPAFAVQPFASRTFVTPAFRSFGFGFRSRGFFPGRFAAPVRFGGFRR